MRNYSIAIFGSTLRSDFDKYSDKDLLVVADDYQTLHNLKVKYSKDDWSISYYTYSKLQFLSKNGSLFIKHLQNESKIIIDQNDRLFTVLSEFTEKKNYKKDIIEAEKYFEILAFIPKTDIGYAWFCDSFYVGLRNYLVFKNAENGIFEFSFIKLLNILKEKDVINKSDIKILQELRVVKRNYRDNIIDELPSFEYVEKVIKIAEKIGILNSPQLMPPTEFRKHIEEHILDKIYDPYQRLRLIEGFYSSQKLNIPELKKIISNPQFYASKMKNNEYTMKLIEEIKKVSQCTKELIVYNFNESQ
jgi:predicted nucleotidyltransferase